MLLGAMNDHCQTDLIRLWVLRILLKGNGFSRLVRGTEFIDDDVARLVGLSEWIEWGFKIEDRSAIRLQLTEQLRLLESGGERVGILRRVQNNFRSLAKVIGLTAFQAAILQFLAVLEDEPVLDDAVEVMDRLDRVAFSNLIACALAIPRKSIHAALEPGGVLMRSGFVQWKMTSNSGARLFLSMSGVGQHLLHEQFSLDTVVREVVKAAPPATLCLSDFSHLKETLTDVRAHLRFALRERRRGINIFIYGPPGTGKTELVRVIARSLRCPAFDVSFEDGDGDPMGAMLRMVALRIANVLLSERRSLLVFDEAEDIFRGGGLLENSPADKCKAWVNRILETNAIPTIWISNSVTSLDRAFVRRFDFVFEVASPPINHRIKTYRRICHTASNAVIRRIARCEAITPAVLARADTVVRATRRNATCPERESALLRLLENTLRAQGHNPAAIKNTVTPAGEFEAEFLNCDPPFEDLDRMLTGDVSCRICLHGPPGTGKTSFGQWVADRIGRPIHTRTGGDVLKPHVGETEATIARLFQEACDENAVLMIDEIDSLLADRSNAVRTWEVSQVNELLTQLERFPGIFIASTNRIEAIDPAALRRFDLKLKLDYLTGHQAADLLESRCRSLRLGHLSEDDRRVASSLQNATPGDFAVASRQHGFRPFANAAGFLEAVIRECASKRGGPCRTIGFS